MKIAIMQPYFVPYIGYFQLLNAVDKFVIYDDIQYTKKGWINRNRILANNKDSYISLPLKKDSDYLDIRERRLADTWEKERSKILNRITQSYRKAPFFSEAITVIEKALICEHNNLFDFLLHTLNCLCQHLDIQTEIVTSSSLNRDRELKSQDMVIAICQHMKANDYVNPIGGTDLYNKQSFEERGINLHFLKSEEIQYQQASSPFIPWLSILDVIMYNSTEDVQGMISHSYKLE